MEKDPKAITTTSGDLSPEYGESEPARVNISQRIWDSFKQNPNAQIVRSSGADGNTFDVENATENAANSSLHRRLKGRHMQMIAIGGSIGMSTAL